MPEEVRAAKRINQEGERIIEKAQEEAERIVARAQEQAAFLINERGLTEAADDESRRIIATRRGGRAGVRRGADDYAAGRARGPRGGGHADAAQHRAGDLAMLDDRRAAHAPAGRHRRRLRRRPAGRDAGDGRSTRRRPRPPPGDEPRPVPVARIPSTRTATRSSSRSPASWPRRPARSASTRSTPSTWTRATASSSPSPSPAPCGCRARTAASSPKARLATVDRRRVRALPAAARHAGQGPHRRGGPAVDRPRERLRRRPRGGRRPRDDAPHRPPRARPAAARRRGDQPRRADRAAVRAGLPRPVPRVRRAPRARARARGRGHRPPDSRRCGPSGSTIPAIAGRLPARPQDPAVARLRAHRRGTSSITRPRRGRAPA